MGKVKKSNKTETKKSNKKKLTLRLLLFGIAGIAVMVYFFNLVVNMSLEIASKYKEKEKLNQQLEELKEKEEELSTDVLKLQDPEYIARYLREKYYYSKSNEYIIKLPTKK